MAVDDAKRSNVLSQRELRRKSPKQREQAFVRGVNLTIGQVEPRMGLSDRYCAYIVATEKEQSSSIDPRL